MSAVEAHTREEKKAQSRRRILDAAKAVFFHDGFVATNLDKVAEETLRCLRRAVPPAVPGIGFLSGGQSDADATAHLDAMNRLDPQPWALSFSFGRAIGRAALEGWGGSNDDSGGQAALLHRARMNGLASLGQWTVDLETDAACRVRFSERM